MKKRVLLCTLGTRGDFYPFLAMATQLRDLGNDVTIATHRENADECSHEGISFLRLGPDLSALDGLWHRVADRDSIQFIVGLLLSELRSNFTAIRGHGFDVLINHPFVFSGPVAAEKLEKRWISIALTPFGLFSASDPPVLPQIPLFHRPIRGFPLLYRPLMSLADLMFRPLAKPIQDFRREHGLPYLNKNPISFGQFSPYGTWGIFDPILSKVQPDWSSNTSILGFPRWQGRLTSSGHISSNYPVVVALGSSWSLLTKPELRKLLADLRRIGERALIVGGSQTSILQQEISSSDPFTVIREINYSDVLPGAKLFLNSGGIGAVAEGLYHRMWQVILPLANDQYDNARRIQYLGLGIAVSRKKLGSHEWMLPTQQIPAVLHANFHENLAQSFYKLC